ncbi:MAG: Cof-type HAD-IIB family hydrolase [Firmicutes bacterium]|nr:Cof-type HAD-IIB family hydrolase [Bacillota bacterium]
MYKLIACDIDGTILTSDGDVTVRFMEVLKLARSVGIPVVIVTGRRIASAIPIAAELELPGPLVTHSGAVALTAAEEHILMARHIRAGLAEEVCSMGHKHGASVAVYENVYAGRTILVTTERELHATVRAYPTLAPYCKRVSGFGQACSLDPVQITLRGEPAVMDKVVRELRTTYARDLSFIDYGQTETEDYLVDVFASGVNKATGLKFITDTYAIDPSEVVAFGDGVNDTELLEFAGLGVAMGNSPDSVREAADIVTATNDEDGVAVIIEDLFSRGLLHGVGHAAHPPQSLT